MFSWITLVTNQYYKPARLKSLKGPISSKKAFCPLEILPRASSWPPDDHAGDDDSDDNQDNAGIANENICDDDLWW